MRSAGPALVVALAWATMADRAVAQDLIDEEPPPPVYVAELRLPGRLVIGFDFGIGVLDAVCTACYSVGALSLDGFAGYQLGGRVALVADAWALLHLLAEDGEESGVASLALAGVGARVWVQPRLWIQAGPSIAWSGTFGPGGDDIERTYGATFAVGGEPGHQRCRGVDLSMRVGGGRFRDGEGGRALVYNLAAMVGFHWN